MSTIDSSAPRHPAPDQARVGPVDVAAFSVYIISKAAMTGATYDVDGGQHLLG